MAMGNALALGVQTPQINTVANYQASQANAQQMKAAQQQQEAAALEQLATIGFGVMDGNLDGPIDPAKVEQAAAMLGDSPLAAKIKADPEFLRTVTKGSLNVLKFAQDTEQFELAKKKFELDLANSQKGPDPTSDIQEYEYAKKNNGYEGTLEEWKATKGASDEDFAKEPTYYKVKQPDGTYKVQFGQLGSRGTFKPTALPENAEPAVPVQQLNTETGFQPVTKFGDQPAGAATTPINNEQAAYDTGVGKGQAELDVAKPEKKRKVEGALNALERQQEIVGADIDKAIETADTNGLFTTGFLGDLTKAVAGTPAYDMAQTLLTIQANVGFDRLQEMRQNSPTGGALGAISDKETALLQAVNGALAQGQSKDQFKANLKRIKDLQVEVLAERKQAFNQDFGAGSSSTGTPAPAGGADDVVDAVDFFN